MIFPLIQNTRRLHARNFNIVYLKKLPYSQQLEYLCHRNNEKTHHHGNFSKQQHACAKAQGSRTGGAASGTPPLRNTARIVGGGFADFCNSRRRNAAQRGNDCGHRRSDARSGQLRGKRTRRFQILKGTHAACSIRAACVRHKVHAHAAHAPHTHTICRTTAPKIPWDIYIPYYICKKTKFFAYSAIQSLQIKKLVLTLQRF